MGCQILCHPHLCTEQLISLCALSKLRQCRDRSSVQVTGVSYKWYASVAGLPNLYSVIDGLCTLKVENNCYTENTFYMKQAVTKCKWQMQQLRQRVYYCGCQIQINGPIDHQTDVTAINQFFLMEYSAVLHENVRVYTVT